MSGTLFKSGRMSMQYVTKKTGQALIFAPSKDGTHSRLVLEDSFLIEELKAEIPFMNGIIYIDENESTASTDQEVQDAYKRKVIEEYLATQAANANPAPSISAAGPVIAASTSTLAAVGIAATSQAAITAAAPAPKAAKAST